MATRLEGDLNRTRLSVLLGAQIEPSIFTLPDPYRVIIDLPNVLFHAEDQTGHPARGLVSTYRYGLIAPGRSRIVIDTPGPVAVDSMKQSRTSDGIRLDIDLVATSRDAFVKAATRQRAEVEVPPKPDAPTADAGDKRPVIVIDPGHGGIDMGAHGQDGEQEKKVVLDFGLALRAKLDATGRYRVVMTRDDDRFIALADRVRVAREAGAQLFVSIHADSISDPFGVRGATVYTLSDRASDAEAEKLAEKENRADVIAGVDLTSEPDEVAGILIDLARRETKAFSARFAQNLVISVKGAVRLNKNPNRSAGFMVLKAPDVPSVLLELGYMSNRDDLKLLTSEEWRNTASGAMVAAVDRFFGYQKE
ncbi:N-acetylmuramoyl-L-alanine amidase [Flaviflagellibacter deserti]|uniref:N-acetylmuramoyl-L-alanine amidase n=1 Tax=Flaviflagellibacter deserti TaxID=2267266 RepID=A0ABV9Z2M2_9HYPH